ncbi:hypothetical protein SDC9_206620 [bioreactor metagenome]|uniref:Uncharacterized protein n=1 Tax=bioreactor metagenome TaxID=1076179 RepID=A0A645JER6_9ZZZZ
MVDQVPSHAGHRLDQGALVAGAFQPDHETRLAVLVDISVFLEPFVEVGDLFDPVLRQAGGPDDGRPGTPFFERKHRDDRRDDKNRQDDKEKFFHRNCPTPVCCMVFQPS